MMCLLISLVDCYKHVQYCCKPRKDRNAYFLSYILRPNEKKLLNFFNKKWTVAWAGWPVGVGGEGRMRGRGWRGRGYSSPLHKHKTEQKFVPSSFNEVQIYRTRGWNFLVLNIWLQWILDVLKNYRHLAK